MRGRARKHTHTDSQVGSTGPHDALNLANSESGQGFAIRDTNLGAHPHTHTHTERERERYMHACMYGAWCVQKKWLGICI